MGYHFNHLDEAVFMAGPKPMLTELAFIIDWRIVSCFHGTSETSECQAAVARLQSIEKRLNKN